MYFTNHIIRTVWWVGCFTYSFLSLSLAQIFTVLVIAILLYLSLISYMIYARDQVSVQCVCVCVCACVRACMRACVRVCVWEYCFPLQFV